MRNWIKEHLIYLFAILLVGDSVDYWVWNITGNKPDAFSWLGLIGFVVGMILFSMLLELHKKYVQLRGGRGGMNVVKYELE